MNEEEFNQKFAELKQKIGAKIDLKEGEFEAKFEEMKKEVSALGIPADKVNQMALTRAAVSYRKVLSSNAEMFEGTILGFGRSTDFGASRTFESIKDTWSKGDETVRKIMIEKGECDSEGNPLWCKENTKATFKYQDNDGNPLPIERRRIDLEAEKQRSGVLIVKKEGEDKSYRANMVLKREKLNIPIPALKRKVKFRAVGKLVEGVYKLYSEQTTEFNVLDEADITEDELKGIAREYFSDCVLDLDSQKPMEWVAENPDKRDILVVNALVTRVPVGGNPIEIGHLDSMFDEEGIITCWIPSTYELNVAESQNGIIAIGQVAGKEEKMSINLYSFFNPNGYEKPQPLGPEPTQDPNEKPL